MLSILRKWCDYFPRLWCIHSLDCFPWLSESVRLMLSQQRVRWLGRTTPVYLGSLLASRSLFNLPVHYVFGFCPCCKVSACFSNRSGLLFVRLTDDISIRHIHSIRHNQCRLSSTNKIDTAAGLSGVAISSLQNHHQRGRERSQSYWTLNPKPRLNRWGRRKTNPMLGR